MPPGRGGTPPGLLGSDGTAGTLGNGDCPGPGGIGVKGGGGCGCGLKSMCGPPPPEPPGGGAPMDIC